MKAGARWIRTAYPAEVFRFFARQPVLLAGAVLALVSACFVPPDGAYLRYIDGRTMALLFALLLVMEGLKDSGILHAMGHALLGIAHTGRRVAMVLVFLCFFSSMVMTNDVALITFVPLTLSIGPAIGEAKAILRVVIWQTIAANIGSMMTPLGSPHNLFLSQRGGMGFADVAAISWPYALVCGVMLLGVLLTIPPIKRPFHTVGAPALDVKRSIVYLAGFGCCIACVARVLPLFWLMGIILPSMAFCKISLFRKVDYALLLTFAVFFVFVGNLARIPEVHRVLERSVKDHLLATGILSSQIVSNVPATLLLAPFTQNVRGLMIAVNLGGLGTLIASMASLISYRLVESSRLVSSGEFLRAFTLWNAVFLAVLTMIAAWMPNV